VLLMSSISFCSSAGLLTFVSALANAADAWPASSPFDPKSPSSAIPSSTVMFAARIAGASADSVTRLSWIDPPNFCCETIILSMTTDVSLVVRPQESVTSSRPLTACVASMPVTRANLTIFSVIAVASSPTRPMSRRTAIAASVTDARDCC
jgi:hypothetical protein